jgi:hypothetical protein
MIYFLSNHCVLSRAFFFMNACCPSFGSFIFIYCIFLMEDGNLYLRLRTMSHTIYAAKFEQTIIHQHVHLPRESQSHESACSHVAPLGHIIRIPSQHVFALLS